MLNAFFYGLLANSALILGGLLGLWINIGKRPLGLIMAFGAGVLMLAYQLEHGPWAIAADLIYMGLAAEKGGLGPLQNTQAKADFDETIFTVAGFYELADTWEAYAGLRYWDLSGNVEIIPGIEPSTPITGSASEDWIDPLIGLRFDTPFAKNWKFVALADIGGFGVGSDFAWHTTLYASWQPTNLLSVILGYRYLDADYESGSGADYFKWDVAQGGPTIGLGFRF